MLVSVLETPFVSDYTELMNEFNRLMSEESTAMAKNGYKPVSVESRLLKASTGGTCAGIWMIQMYFELV